MSLHRVCALLLPMHTRAHTRKYVYPPRLRERFVVNGLQCCSALWACVASATPFRQTGPVVLVSTPLLPLCRDERHAVCVCVCACVQIRVYYTRRWQMYTGGEDIDTRVPHNHPRHAVQLLTADRTHVHLCCRRWERQHRTPEQSFIFSETFRFFAVLLELGGERKREGGERKPSRGCGCVRRLKRKRGLL